MTNTRYIPVKNQRGIRKDLKANKFQVRKKIDGKTYTEVFSKVSEAIKWRDSFHPSNQTFSKSVISKAQVAGDNVRTNGVETRYYFKEVWNLYQKLYLPSIEPQSAKDTIKRANNIFPDFLRYRMVDINAEVIDDVIRKKVEEYHLSDNKKLRRYSYDKELQTLRAVLNWYKENYDVMFVVPVLKRHFLAGVVRKKSNRKKKKMSPEQVLSFFDSFDSVFWKDFAKIHFYMAGRVQEPAGLQWDNVDFDNKLLIVSDVAVWGYSKRFEYLKEVPKNSEERIVHINDEMLEILKRRKKNECLNEDLLRLSDGQPLNFVFHENGEPLNFRQVQYRYNKALKRAGLYPEFSATHILRKAMANIVRQMMGLDAAQAVGGWKSREIVEKVYTDSLPTELNKSAVNNVQGLMKSLEKV